jgi:hypothetical protein
LVWNLLSLAHLDFYLGVKRGHPLNANSYWRSTAPPKMGRIKRDALRDFAIKEYNEVVWQDRDQKAQLDRDLLETLKYEIEIMPKAAEEGSDDMFCVCLRDDDIL